jgi:leucyl aminopeptidase
MFNISHNLNKKAEISVIFVDNNFKFLNQLNFFSKNQLKQINLFKNDFAELDLLKLDLLDNDKKQKIVIYKIKDDLKEYDFQKAGGLVYAEISKFKSANIFFDTDLSIDNYKYKFFSNFLLGLMSRSYNFKNYKFKKDNSKNILQSLSILSSDKATLQKSIRYAQNIYSGIEETRNLVTLPANILNPKKFVDEILKLKKIGVSVEILNEKKMKSLGMNAILGVGQGSSNESYIAIMKWNGNKSSKEKPLAFVGKGVCFDTGGISLKPASHMEDMKYDMGGAGTVTGLMKVLALRKAKVNVVGVVGLVENMADGNAQRPGDVVISYSGQSIEVLNTDAEGRLVLADAIAYTEDRFKPKFIINLATLTGAIVVSLGNEYAGLFSNDDKLAKQIHETSLKDNEKAWRFPLHKNYDKLMDSKIADLQNINYSGGAGSITAAQFLQRFIRNKTPWAHLDIAGMAWTKKDTAVIPEGATGYGVKLLNRLVEEHYEK